ncbi:TraB/VirB10 family protein [Klebsiella pneumoniae]|uniref:TraB/VirB10 family protein n=1 Tax=Klebsiella pneumoniae TaxID=573 RepID=UPI0029490C43|nr:TraB/VirB10 family protein [Klebsiella pneumoniae]MDV5598772.1 TraB/VirB10 family protein [Klebsiella pneumoniae]
MLAVRMTRLRQDLDRLTQKNMELAKKVETGVLFRKTSSSSEMPEPMLMVHLVVMVSSWRKVDYKDPASFFRDAPLPDSKGRAPAPAADGQDATKPGIQIVSYSQKAPEVEEKDNKDDESIYLPSGSILTGVLINGMDAPTSQGARRDPFPSTLRIQKEAILPNRFRADVRECFLIVSGYGDLSSERAYLRGETFSCVRDDGGVIEAKLDSYAVGEDGKAGVRGRVVSKQGQIIAKSLMAGFLGGVSEAFDVNPVPVVSTNPGSNTQYQSVFSDQMLQGAAVKGASKALDRIAQFYIDMAEGIFPVIEVDAGRQVDIIVTKGTKLQIRSTGGTKK